MSIKYPEIVVQLTGSNGNAIAIMSKVKRTLKHAGVPTDKQDAFQKEALSGNYNHVLRTCMCWVTVE